MFGVLCPPSTLVGETGFGCLFLLWCVFLITSISYEETNVCVFGVLCPPRTLVGGTGVGCHFLLWCVFLITSISVTDPSRTVLFPVISNCVNVPFVYHCPVDYCYNVSWCMWVPVLWCVGFRGIYGLCRWLRFSSRVESLCACVLLVSSRCIFLMYPRSFVRVSTLCFVYVFVWSLSLYLKHGTLSFGKFLKTITHSCTCLPILHTNVTISYEETNVLGWNGDPFYLHILFHHGVMSHQTHSVHLWQPAPSQGQYYYTILIMSYNMGLFFW